LGLIIPAFLEILELRKYKIPSMLSALLVIAGGLILRFIVVDAGQASRWLY
jgi:formate-dependent nitrite reductase membrane component NrfD